MGERAPTVRSDRFSILLRDGFRCRYCGRSSSEDGVKLHVDHVVPRSAGGPSTRDNLVTACQDCNLGKGARIMP
jgi:5-methylcytosine-specific restriction endonuclease McrA